MLLFKIVTRLKLLVTIPKLHATGKTYLTTAFSNLGGDDKVGTGPRLTISLSLGFCAVLSSALDVGAKLDSMVVTFFGASENKSNMGLATLLLMLIQLPYDIKLSFMANGHVADV